MSKEDVHVIAQAFCRSLREQVPLLSGYVEWVAMGKMSECAERLGVCAKLLLRCPYQTELARLLQLLNTVHKQRDVSLMSAYNLSVVFTPILLRPHGNDDMTMMANLEPATEAVRFLIKHIGCCSLGAKSSAWRHGYTAVADDLDDAASAVPKIVNSLSPSTRPTSPGPKAPSMQDLRLPVSPPGSRRSQVLPTSVAAPSPPPSAGELRLPVSPPGSRRSQVMPTSAASPPPVDQAPSEPAPQPPTSPRSLQSGGSVSPRNSAPPQQPSSPRSNRVSLPPGRPSPPTVSPPLPEADEAPSPTSPRMGIPAKRASPRPMGNRAVSGPATLIASPTPIPRRDVESAVSNFAKVVNLEDSYF